MLMYVVRRICVSILVALFVSGLSFFLLYAAGDPATAILGASATETDIAAVRERYGFDRPLIVQYASWLWRALQGDFGDSFFLRVPVEILIAQRLPVTMLLGSCAIVFALVLAIPLGVVAALRPNSIVDRLALFISVIGQAMPSFWFALLLITWFSVAWPLLPSSGSDSWQHFVLPTVALGYYAMPAIMRLTRSGMIEVMNSDYIRTARSKGLSSWQITVKHALRNAIVPVVSLAAAQFGFMLAGSVVIESVFAIQGAGRLAYESIVRGDIPTMQAVILIFSLTYVVLTFAADLLVAWLSPRVRLV